MSEIRVATLTILAVALCALSFSYDVILRNGLSSTVRVELRQYHGVEFDGTRPESWSEEFLVRSLDGDLVPGEQDTVTFDDATGGFWVVWSVVDYGTSRHLCGGEIDFTAGKSPFKVVLSQENCGGNR